MRSLTKAAHSLFRPICGAPSLGGKRGSAANMMCREWDVRVSQGRLGLGSPRWRTIVSPGCFIKTGKPPPLVMQRAHRAATVWISSPLAGWPHLDAAVRKLHVA